jgi:hypothetical protein
MRFHHSPITAAVAGMALLTGIVAGPAQAQQDAPTQGPHSAPNTQNLDSNDASGSNGVTETQNLDSNESSDSNRVSDTTKRNSEQVSNLIERRAIRGNDFFVRGDRSSVLVPQGPHGAVFPVRAAGFGGPDLLRGSSDYPKVEIRGPHGAPHIAD